MNPRVTAYKLIRRIIGNARLTYTGEFVEYAGQQANDLIAEAVSAADGQGLMISRFGTIELDNLFCYLVTKKKGSARVYWDSIRRYGDYYPEISLRNLCMNAGFFPEDRFLWEKYCELTLNDVPEIDILASYQRSEIELAPLLKAARRVDLDGFYAPYLWKHPWSRLLEGKRVLVVHPFADSISAQYEKREKLFKDAEVLPQFTELKIVKAVQTLGCNSDKVPFRSWFEALEKMEDEIDKAEYDIAIIGCGAYGMNLAAHVKRRRKIAIHLAGWTQMLFGIYGRRWVVDQPKFSSFINADWCRPSENERPSISAKVENGCYW